MFKWLHKVFVLNSQNASIASLIGSFLAIISAIISAFLAYHFTIVAQTRQAKLEQIIKFESSASQIIEAGGQFITAVNSKKDLGPVREKLSSVLAAQVVETQSVERFFELKTREPFEAFENSLSELNLTARKTSTADEMRPWAESFGRTLDRKSELSKLLYASVGLDRG